MNDKKTLNLFLKKLGSLEKRFTFAAAYRGKHFTKRIEINKLNKKQLTDGNDVWKPSKLNDNKTKTLAIKFGSVEKSSIFAARLNHTFWNTNIKESKQSITRYLIEVRFTE